MAIPVGCAPGPFRLSAITKRVVICRFERKTIPKKEHVLPGCLKILIGNRPGRWDAASGHMLTQGGRVILATLPASVEWGLKRQSAATVNAVNDGLMNHQ